MSKVQYLREQAARADRLARAAFDSVTTKRLQQAAKDYLLEADQLAAGLTTIAGPDKTEAASSKSR
jgi:hypothetical protein